MTRALIAVAVALALVACSEPVDPPPDLCAEWSWLEEEACLMEVCADLLELPHFECRGAGECWCCDDAGRCLDSERSFP
jgi:hypothetical protein